mmetsp:Transcript_82628/g.207919  ORF Transcript_82628/g.207919 Transcript_82628/m.207919 type:complete len:96 (-) Transcript_82628:106-393(-)
MVHHGKPYTIALKHDKKHRSWDGGPGKDGCLNCRNVVLLVYDHAYRDGEANKDRKHCRDKHGYARAAVQKAMRRGNGGPHSGGMGAALKGTTSRI